MEFTAEQYEKVEVSLPNQRRKLCLTNLLDREFEKLQLEQIVRILIEAFSLRYSMGPIAPSRASMLRRLSR